MRARSLLGVGLVLLCLAACRTETPITTPAPTSLPASAVAPAPTPIALPTTGAFASGVYRNLFKEMLGKSDTDIQAKIDAAWQQLFYGDDANERVYYPVGSDMAYITDIGNNDVRTEGMSYGMMIAVQMNKKEEFDRLWKWAKTYLYQTDGPYKGYFAWHATTDGKQIDSNPASDGEEWFTTALLFADKRWGSGTGIFNYGSEAQAILDTMRTKSQANGIATDMFDPQAHQVVFVPTIGDNSSFTDPSYHLPAFYEIWARRASHDNQFWSDAAQTSRTFWQHAANPQTGLMPDYAEFNGAPHGTDGHQDFRFDAFRVASNLALDHAWFNADPWQVTQSNRLLDFFDKQGIDNYANQFTLAGKPLSSDHSPGLVAMNAVAALAATNPNAPKFVRALWDTPIPSGHWRYYDGMLYFLGLLEASGNFKSY